MNRKRKNNRTPMTIQQIDQILARMNMKKKQKNEVEDVPFNINYSIQEIHQHIDLATQHMESIFSHVESKNALPLDEIEEEIIPTIKKAAEIPHVYHLFYELNHKDEYTYKHAISVGIIATIVGKWLNLPQDKLAKLTIGASLHDIGKVKIPKEILNKPGRLTKDEYEEMKRHTIYGYEILRNTKNLDDEIALIALQHHEREDGNGYPIGLYGHQINDLAKIVSISDVFHAMSSERIYQEAVPFYKVIKQMEKDAFGKFDPTITLTFLNKMMNLLIGRKVLLTDGSIGSIAMIHPYDPLRCLIQLDNRHIDLRYELNVQIERVLSD